MRRSTRSASGPAHDPSDDKQKGKADKTPAKKPAAKGKDTKVKSPSPSPVKDTNLKKVKTATSTSVDNKAKPAAK